MQECFVRGLHRYLCAAVHDELVACVPDAEVDWFAEQVREVMVQGMVEIVGDAVPIKVEVRQGQTWS
jgi:DNA polymerase I-like protein with 3'-5' exonuclease and polymerase domains